MSVSGWTEYGDRTWSGDEINGISPDSMSVLDGGSFLTKNEFNNSIGDFDFEVDVETEAWGTDDKGGLSFCLNTLNIDQNYVLLWTIDGSNSKFTLYKNNTSGKGDSGTKLGSTAVFVGNSTSFKIKIKRVGDDFSVSFNGSAYTVLASDSTYTTGNIGFVYPSSQWNCYDTFKNIKINIYSSINRRIIIIS